MSTNLAKPLRLRNDGGAQLQLERSGSLTSLETTSGGGLALSTAGTLALAATGANVVTLATNAVERLRITAAGNFGFGVSSPAYFLDGSTTDGNILRLSSIGATLASFNSGGNIFFGTGTSNPLLLMTGEVERLRITTAGHTLPGSNNAYDLGASGTAFRDLYTAGAVVSFAGLPTSDPGVAGRLWRSGADIKVSI